MAQDLKVKASLRRSFSEHVKDSTNKVRDVFWRSVRERWLWEIEAKEACDWLQAAGFPQYVQLFKDCRFPIDIEWAKRDHHFLDTDALDSMCRRLITLNKCASMRLELRRSKRRGDDFEEDFCAISPNWTYDRRTCRWRRLEPSVDIHCLSHGPSEPQGGSVRDVSDRHEVCSVHSSCSTDSDGHNGPGRIDQEPAPVVVTAAGTTDDQGTSSSSSRCSSTNKTPSLDSSFSGPPSPGSSGEGSSSVSLEAESCSSDKSPRRKCTALLRKMEKLKLRGSTGLFPCGHSDSSRIQHVISPPVLIQEDRLERPQCLSSWQGHPSSAAPSSPSPPPSSSSSSSSAVSTPSPVARVRSKRTSSGRTSWNNQNHTGTETYRNQINNSNSSHENVVFQVPDGHRPGTFPTSLAHKHQVMTAIIDDTSVNWRTGSFHAYGGRTSCRHGTPDGAGVPGPVLLDHRLSIYDNVPSKQPLPDSECGSDTEPMGEESEAQIFTQSFPTPVKTLTPLGDEDVFSALDNVLERISNLQQLVNTWSENLFEDDPQKSSSSSEDSPTHGSSATYPCPCSPSHIHLEEMEEMEEMEEAESCGKVPASEAEPTTRALKPRSSKQNLPCAAASPGLENQSVSQFSLLQKLSLLKLTALMDKYSLCSKQGWSWTVPKPQRKAEVMEVKGRRVFGVPLLLNVQQTGEALPPSILRALLYLRTQCLDQVGLFRKSGLKSRIRRLRELVESDPDSVSYEGQSAFDVADMVKQYFRDLPEPIFTSKLCKSFLHIYQYFPKDQQLVAVQAAILLLPDENREALRSLFFLLWDVVARVEENQMTPTNIAVCLAPSLFHLNTVKRDTKAARSSHRKYSLGRPDQHHLTENLAATQGLANMITEAQRLFQLPEFWPGQSCAVEGGGAADVDQEERRSELQTSTRRLLKEARERSRGWQSRPAPEHVELAFKKLHDGCPLWMWRGSVEVDASHQELLHRLLREQELWVRNLRQAAVVQTLAANTEVHVLRSHGHDLDPRPPQEHLLLRTWQAEPTSGPLYLSSVSTHHPQVPVEGVRVHVHSCLYLLEPTGARKTLLTHVCRTDTRDRSLEWHCRVSGRRLASGLLAIRDSFRPDCKETKI